MEIALLVYVAVLILVYLLVTRDLMSPIYPLTLFVFAFAGLMACQDQIMTGFAPTGLDIVVFMVAMFLLFVPTLIVCARWKRAFRVTPLRMGRATRIVLWGLFWCTFMVYLKIEFINNQGRIPLLMMLDGSIREAGIEKIHRFGKDSRLQLLVAQLPVIACFFVPMIMQTRKKALKLLRSVPLVLVMVFGILKTSKSDVVLSGLMFFIVAYYTSTASRRTKNMLVVCGIIVFSLLCLYMTFQRVDSQGGVYADLIAYDDSDDRTPYVSYVFGYTGGSLVNFFEYMERTGYELTGEHWGLSFFRPAATLGRQSHAIDAAVAGKRMYVLGAGATVGTYLRTVYLEGGILLVLLASLVYALLVNGIYRAFVRTGDFWLLVAYAIVYIPWFMLFFQNLFANLHVYFGLFVVLVAGFWAGVRTAARRNRNTGNSRMHSDAAQHAPRLQIPVCNSNEMRL